MFGMVDIAAVELDTANRYLLDEKDFVMLNVLQNVHTFFRSHRNLVM